jgi:hypothetical protein
MHAAKSFVVSPGAHIDGGLVEFSATCRAEIGLAHIKAKH